MIRYAINLCNFAMGCAVVWALFVVSWAVFGG